MKFKGMLPYFSILLVLVILFSACGKTEDKNNGEKKGRESVAGTEKVTEPTYETIDISEYSLVRKDNGTSAEKEALVAIRKAIMTDLGVTLKALTDFDGKSKKEILIGDTSRDESKRAMEEIRTENDYIIRKDGDKIVIVAGSDETIASAAALFIEKCIDKEGKTFKVPDGKGITYFHKLKIKSLTVDGTDISEFSVIDKTGVGSGTAEYLVKTLGTDYIGRGLKITDKSVRHAIILDESGISYTDYDVKIADGNITITGSYHSVKSAVDAIFALLDKGGDVALASSDSFAGKADAPEIPYKTKDELMQVMNYLYDSDYILFGEHLAGNMDVKARIEGYYEAVGEYPSIMDFDMLRLKDHPREVWSKALCEFVEFAEKGGVITTMHHWLSPVDPSQGFRGHLGTLADWRELLTDGTALNLKWREELDRAGEFMRALQDAGVSFLYRPMHEVNGNWFWFCAIQENEAIPAEDVINMWKYVYNYYTENYGITNILWEYGPNLTNSETSPLPVLYYYPSDEYCDIVGFDWYTDGDIEAIDGEGQTYNNLADCRKPVAIMEWGVGGTAMTGDMEIQSSVFSCNNYVDMLETMRQDGKRLAFAEVYAGQYGSPTFIGDGEALANYKWIVHLEEMPALIKTVLGK